MSRPTRHRAAVGRRVLALACGVAVLPALLLVAVGPVLARSALDVQTLLEERLGRNATVTPPPAGSFPQHRQQPPTPAEGETAGQSSIAPGLEDVRGLAHRAVQEPETLAPHNEHYLGRAVAALMLTNYPPLEDEAANAYVTLIGKTLAAASDRPETFNGYRFQILDSDEINALATPGGFIFITRGLVACCRTEDALAAVLAHEIAHVQLAHGVQAIRRSRLSGALSQLAFQQAKSLADAELASLVDAFEGAVTDIFTTAMRNGYSKRQEGEADVAAVALLQRVGYDPSGLVDMLLVMDERLSPARHDFSRTHPTPTERYQHIMAHTPFEYTPVRSPPVRAERFQAALDRLLPAEATPSAAP